MSAETSADTLNELLREDFARDPNARLGFEEELGKMRWASQIKKLREAAGLTQPSSRRRSAADSPPSPRSSPGP
jgi:hypothetical protein